MKLFVPLFGSTGHRAIEEIINSSRLSVNGMKQHSTGPIPFIIRPNRLSFSGAGSVVLQGTDFILDPARLKDSADMLALYVESDDWEMRQKLRVDSGEIAVVGVPGLEPGASTY